MTVDYEVIEGAAVYQLSYDIALDDGTLFRLSMGITEWCEEEHDEISIDDICYADVYPQFANYYWSLDCGNNIESWHDWIYEIVSGNITQYYSISEDSLQEYPIFDDYGDYYDDYYEDPGATYIPEEPTRLTQYEWPDYCDEMDCLMMESVGLQYNESFGTATKLLTSGSLITISIVSKIGGGAEYGANVRVDGITTIPVKSSNGINYKCKSTGGKGGNMGGYSGLCITLTKDGWSNWY